MKNIIFAILIGFVTTAAFAESGKVGRLDDGRAYRVDENGDQLVDYLAELELQVEGLNQQVAALQNEIDDKNAKLAVRPIQERAITPVSTQTCPKLECPRLNCAESNAAVEERCNTLATNLEKQLVTLEDSIRARDARIEELGYKLNEAETLAEQNAAAKASLIAQKESLAGEVSLLKTKLTVATSEAAIRTSEPRASLSTSVGSPSAAKNGATEAVRGMIRTELNKLSGLVDARSKLYGQYRTMLTARQNGLTKIAMSDLVDRNGENLNTLRKRAQGATTIRELSAINKSIAEIRTILNDDIATFKRLVGR